MGQIKKAGAANTGAGDKAGDNRSLSTHIVHQDRKNRQVSRVPLPGSFRARRRARTKLMAQQIRPGLWLVTGGEVGHGVIVDGESLTYTCDCDGQAGARDQMCSHAIAVWYEIDGEPSQRWNGTRRTMTPSRLKSRRDRNQRRKRARRQRRAAMAGGER